MKNILVLLFLFCNCSVNRLPQQNIECTQESASKIADFAMRRPGMNLSNYNKTIKDEGAYYVIIYDLIRDSTKIVVGGGGKIKISKKTCKIIEKKFYQ